MNNTAISSLSPILHNSMPVLTTELLAKLYGTDTDNLKKNFSRNTARFVAGKHFLKVVGMDLQNLRVTLSHSQNPISSKTRTLILWTERGAARHAKMLETDQAWEVFERLEDCYFNQHASAAPLQPVAPVAGGRVLLTFGADGQLLMTETLRENVYVVTAQEVLELLEMQGWIVMPQEKLQQRIKEIFNPH